MLFFFGSSATAAEKEQAAALKAVIDARKGPLKQELKQMEQDAKEQQREAKRAFQQQEREIHMGAIRNMAERVQQEIAAIQATDEYQHGDEKTKKCIDQAQSWILWGLSKEAMKHGETLNYSCGSSCQDATTTSTVAVETGRGKDDGLQATMLSEKDDHTLVQVY
ncbi:hypothetical protein DFQ26_007035 [Actinomortierella ambigua]|nr:hypothetical protein DFQ26_007035 [Actinomortierella ambigua]